jgi:hypothetical protein
VAAVVTSAVAFGAWWTGRCGTVRRGAGRWTGFFFGGAACRAGTLGRTVGTASVGVADGVADSLSQALGVAAPPAFSCGTGPHAVRRTHATRAVTKVLPRITVTPFDRLPHRRADDGAGWRNRWLMASDGQQRRNVRPGRHEENGRVTASHVS